MKIVNRSQMRVRKFSGTGLSQGIGFGTAYRVETVAPTYYRISIQKEDIDAELKRVESALARSRRQYLRDKKRLESVFGREHSYIIDAHLQMLEDPPFLDEIRRRIRSLESPEKALRCVAEELLAAYHSLDDPFFRERSFDFEEVVDRITSNLVETTSRPDKGLPEDLILVAPQIGLSALVRFPLDHIKGLVLGRAGRNSHVVIVARSHRIPVVSGIEGFRERVRTGDTLLVDGSTGVVEILASQDDVDKVRQRVAQASQQVPAMKGDPEPCATLDGVRIHFYGNTEVSDEVRLALEMGAEGVGLFRSECIYLKHGGISLGEEEQFHSYRALAETVGERPALVRTLDVGVSDDAGRTQAGEEGAVLGLRGIRLSLKHPELFKRQIRAILRARTYGNLQIVFPMISSVDELLQGRRLVREVEDDLALGKKGLGRISIGLLLEIPGAVWTLDSLARYVDFLAVGTNDLIQYTLAAGRLNEEIAYLYNPLHPAVLGNLRHVASVARKRNLTTFVCGEMAAHPIHSLLLVGMGFSHLSMTPFAIPAIKKMLRRFSFSELKEAAAELLQHEMLSDVERFVEERLGTRKETQEAATELAPMW